MRGHGLNTEINRHHIEFTGADRRYRVSLGGGHRIG